jgi:hypothetical protein
MEHAADVEHLGEHRHLLLLAEQAKDLVAGGFVVLHEV